MKYLIIGAGATGGPLAVFLANKGFDVSVIARKENLKAIQNNGLTIIKSDNTKLNVKVKAYAEDEYHDTPDIIFVCVKGYSLDSTIAFMQKVAEPHTIIIPILNIYTTGEYLQEKFPNNTVTDGCIYIASSIKSYGVIEMQGAIFRVLFGEREGCSKYDKLEQAKNDLCESEIDAKHSNDIKVDAFEKFTFVSTMAACGIYHDCQAFSVQTDETVRNDFITLTKEILLLAEKMQLKFEVDVMRKNLQIMDNLNPSAMASMQRDIAAGGKSEIDGLIHNVAKKAKELSLSLPMYEKISTKFKNI